MDWMRSMQASVPDDRLSLAVATIAVGGVITYACRRSLICAIYDFMASLRHNPGTDFLADNYAPIHNEVHVTELKVEGAVPEGLEGCYIRTGPNPMLTPVGGYHWFDGDGMLHGVKFSQGKACSYANHAVRTARLAQEKALGKPRFMKMGDLWGWPGLIFLMLDGLKKRIGAVDDSQGHGTANTAMVYHAQRLLALNEGDLPYQVRVLCNGIIETLGRLTIGGGNSKLPAFPSPFTAHPKVDPRTGEMFCFGYNMNTKPYVRAGMLNTQGELVKQWPIDTPYPAMMHDCGLTKTYGVILHMPLVFDGEKMVKGGLPLGFKPELGTRIGLLRRDAPTCTVDVLSPHATPAPVQWFDIPTGYAFHVANTWEDDQGLVHVFTSQFKAFNFWGFNAKVKSPPPPEERQHLTRFVLDPATGKTLSVTKMTDLNTDFPVVPPALACYPTRYIYCATFEFGDQTAEACGVAKFDVTVLDGAEACVREIRYPDGCRGGEAVFVPRPASNGQEPQEDDGWLVVYVHDSNTNQTSLNVYDARTMNPQPLARVIMPQRVPYGFHGMFVTAKQLSEQIGLNTGRPAST